MRARYFVLLLYKMTISVSNMGHWSDKEEIEQFLINYI